MRKKGTFTSIRLAVAKFYVYPGSRKKMMLIGGMACLILVAYFLADSLVFSKSFVVRGDLSSNHANFEADCAKCHQSFRAVSDALCSTCHEKTNDELGVYTFAAHYVYRSGERGRAASSPGKQPGKELPCSSCHTEHLGREAAITNVPDAKCVGCHEYGSFTQDHPQFEFARTKTPDDSTLIFTHVRHTKFILEKLQKETGNVYLEKACLYCHVPKSDGKTFKPIEYDAHCGDCHLTTAVETPSLAIKDMNDPLKPGVETLEMIQRRRGPGTQWAFYTNPNDFKTKPGGKVVKSPVYHEDPWILENLRQLRQALYSDVGLSDLLKTSGDVPGNRRAMLYDEALQALRGYLVGLRSRPEPEIQADLARIDSVLKSTEKKLRRLPPTEASAFLLPPDKANPELSPAQRNEFQDFALKLTRPCQECHFVANASIMRVQSDQRVLRRAEFDHRAHILERRCLQCHVDIPVTQAMSGGAPVDNARDRSAIQNIPQKQNCDECHNDRAASIRCVTCHFMHPNKENRASLQLFVEKD